MNLVFFSSSWRWIWFSSKWPLLAFDSGMLLHYNEWGDATAAGPTTTRHQSGTFPKNVWPWLWSFKKNLLFRLGPCLFVLIKGLHLFQDEVDVLSYSWSSSWFSFKWPLPFHSCILLHHNEWGTPTRPITRLHWFFLPVWTLKERALSNFAF